MHGWKGKLLCGVGQNLRAFELGKKKLLRKAEIKSLNSPVNTILPMGDRIFISEMADSFHVMKYRAKEQTFFEIADDILPRWITSSCLLDYHTIVGTDKFENVFVCRLPASKRMIWVEQVKSYIFEDSLIQLFILII